MPHSTPQLIEKLLAPLCIAAYVAWAVVWAGSAHDFETLGPAGELAARLAMVGFMLGFLLCVSDAFSGRSLLIRVVQLAMAMLALGLVAAHRSGVTPILLVLLIAVLASDLPEREFMIWCIVINAAFMGILAYGWGLTGQRLWLTGLAHVSFQAFAALLMRSARRAEEMAERLRATNAELMTTRTLLAEGARDQERLRLSRELHDVAGHGLTALKLNLETLVRDPDMPARERLELCAALADELLQNLRRVVGAMRAEPGIDLRAALERLGAPFPRPRLEIAVDPAIATLTDREEVEAVLRAVQEALTNAAVHGPSRTLRVRLDPQEGDWQLSMEDDGRVNAEVVPGGGLSGMRERFEQLGGRLQTSRAPAGGLRIIARWPRRAEVA